MDVEWIRDYCLSLTQATEVYQWEAVVFKVAGKIFAVLRLEEGRISIKCTPEEAAELVEREGIIPAPYLARNHWVSVQDLGAVTRREMKDLVKRSYDLVAAKLPKKVRAGLQ
jgi:predicted DNA-binding protein (MmcQ/YjbR family)